LSWQPALKSAPVQAGLHPNARRYLSEPIVTEEVGRDADLQEMLRRRQALRRKRVARQLEEEQLQAAEAAQGAGGQAHTLLQG